jgi:hypothetical protein
MGESASLQTADLDLLDILRGVVTWVDAYPDEAANVIRKHLQQSATKQKKRIAVINDKLSSAPQEPELARDCRIALEIGHTEAIAKILLAKQWKIRGKKLDDRYREAFRAHVQHDRLRLRQKADLQGVIREIDPPGSVSIGQRVIQLIAFVDARVAGNEADAAWHGLHSLRDRVGLDDDCLDLVLEKATARPSMVVVSWKIICEHYGLDAGGRKIEQGSRAGQQDGSPPPLSPTEQDAFKIIRALPAGEAIQGRQWAMKAGIDEKTLRTHIVPKLKRLRGLKNRPNVGYYIDPPNGKSA